MTTILVIDDFSPVVQGDTLRPFAPIVQTRDPTTGEAIPFDLTGLTISMKMQSERGTVKTCTGTWTIDDAVNGRCHYRYQPGDVDTPGFWTLSVAFTDVSGHVGHALSKSLEIEEVL